MTLIFPKKSVPALCWYHVTKELLYTFCVQGASYTRWKVATLFVKYLLHFTSKLSHFTFGITFCRDNSIALLHLYYYILRQNIINNNAGSFTSTIAPQLTAIYFLSDSPDIDFCLDRFTTGNGHKKAPPNCQNNLSTSAIERVTLLMCHITPLPPHKRPPLYNSQFLLFPKFPLWRGSTVSIAGCPRATTPVLVYSLPPFLWPWVSIKLHTISRSMVCGWSGVRWRSPSSSKRPIKFIIFPLRKATHALVKVAAKC